MYTEKIRKGIVKNGCIIIEPVVSIDDIKSEFIDV